jgi:ADP-ribose pyrophosphatase YjhB (NUDIX family)
LTDYSDKLRRISGHQPVLLCRMIVLLVDGSDRILLRSKKKNDLWEIPGGMAEICQKVEDTAVRIVFNETGFQIMDMELFGVFSGEEQYCQFPTGDEVYYLTIVFVTKKYAGNLKNGGPEGTDDLRFFGYDNLPASINSLDWPVINSFFRYTG